MTFQFLTRAAITLVIGLAFPQQEATEVKTGSVVGDIISGVRTPPVTRPVRVALLSETYTNMYDSDALHRIDEYWERFKPAFAENRELFYQVSELAQTEAIEFVFSKMRQEGVNLDRMALNSSPDGHFEFRNVPLGEYKVVAFGTLGPNDFVWLGWVNLENSEPVRVQLKTTLP